MHSSIIYVSHIIYFQIPYSSESSGPLKRTGTQSNVNFRAFLAIPESNGLSGKERCHKSNCLVKISVISDACMYARCLRVRSIVVQMEQLSALLRRDAEKTKTRIKETFVDSAVVFTIIFPSITRVFQTHESNDCPKVVASQAG